MFITCKLRSKDKAKGGKPKSISKASRKPTITMYVSNMITWVPFTRFILFAHRPTKAIKDKTSSAHRPPKTTKTSSALLCMFSNGNTM